MLTWKTKLGGMSLSLLLAGMVLTLGLGCNGSVKPKGPISPRLVGKWEARKTFVETITIEFREDGSTVITDTKGDKASSFTGSWYLVEDGKDQLKIQMQASKKGGMEARTVKFQDADFFELKQGAKIAGRFKRLGK